MVNFKFILLSDGRKLSYWEFGKANGRPVFYFHGTPSSCLEPLLIDNEVFIEYGLRIIAPNRPGIGSSDFQNSRAFNDWPIDVLSLADYLKPDKFSVFDNSGGEVYVTACAATIPERLLSTVVVSGGWQMNLPEAKKNLRFPYNIFWIVAEKLPFLLPFLLGTMKSFSKDSKGKRLALANKMMPTPGYDENDAHLSTLCNHFNEADEAILNK
jgi:pimeloyl-ACP methyl ester carboxylesterase